MFTGIVEEVGSVANLEAHSAGAFLRVRCREVLTDARIGSSISVNGVCLTVVELNETSFAADLAPETLERTNLGDLHADSVVNLERPLAATGRLSGHIVQGHVDGTGEMLGLDFLGDGNWWLKIRIPPGLDRYLVDKGSVALDGVSLTIATLDDCILSATIIPHTYENTNFREHAAGARVNIECDILAKHVEKLLAQGTPLATNK